MFPSFDEPVMKAKFTVVLIRDKDHVSLSNMHIKKTLPVSYLFFPALLQPRGYERRGWADRLCEATVCALWVKVP